MSWKTSLVRTLGRRICPGWRASALAGVLEGTAALLDPRRSVARGNLRLAFPDLPEDRRRDLYRSCLAHLAWSVTECLVLDRDPAQALAWMEEVQGRELLEGPRDRGQGVVLVTAHLGNWELCAAWMAQELLTTFDGEISELTLRPGTGGVFEVRADGQTVWSRAGEGRFPDITDLKQRVRDRIAPERDLGHVDRKAAATPGGGANDRA